MRRRKRIHVWMKHTYPWFSIRRTLLSSSLIFFNKSTKTAFVSSILLFCKKGIVLQFKIHSWVLVESNINEKEIYSFNRKRNDRKDNHDYLNKRKKDQYLYHFFANRLFMYANQHTHGSYSDSSRTKSSAFILLIQIHDKLECNAELYCWELQIYRGAHIYAPLYIGNRLLLYCIKFLLHFITWFILYSLVYILLYYFHNIIGEGEGIHSEFASKQSECWKRFIIKCIWDFIWYLLFACRKWRKL